jgi:hypothetical protein
LRRDLTTGAIHLTPVKICKPVFFDFLFFVINGE